MTPAIAAIALAEAVGRPSGRDRRGAARGFTLVPVLLPRVDAQLPAVADDRYAACSGGSCASKYHHMFEGNRVPQDSTASPGGSTAPAAEQNLNPRVKTATAIQVEDPIC